MSDVFIFTAVFVAMFVARIFVATVVFLWILPEADECPICNAPTLRVQQRVWNWCFPKIRTSWCPECGWEGLLRPGRITSAPASRPAHKSATPH